MEKSFAIFDSIYLFEPVIFKCLKLIHSSLPAPAIHVEI